MCYGYKPVYGDAGFDMRTETEIRRLLSEGRVKEGSNGFHYARDTVAVILAGGEVRPMRWDLIPAGFLKPADYTVAEGIKKKNSRAINPSTGKRWGFDSYNARVETIPSTWSFKSAWNHRRRGIIPAIAWRERPNMDNAPPEFKGREYVVQLAEPNFFATLYDTWKGVDGSVESCTVITGPSDEIPELQGIWHERTPIVLNREEAETWLDPEFPPDAAMMLLRGVRAPSLAVKEVLKPG